MKKPRFLGLRIRLISAFLVVALIPLLLLAFINQSETQEILIKNANQSLYAAATQTASQIDTFITTNLNIVRVEAILPIFARALSSTQFQIENLLQTEALATLNSLNRKDGLNIYSYGLLNAQGKNLLDTNIHNLGQDESQEDYFIQALQTQSVYVSSIRFLANQPNLPVIYFSSPVRNAKNQIIGVLRYCYLATAIQQLIALQTGIAGDRSFPMLVDENYIRLADTIEPHLAFSPLVPLSPTQLQKLTQERRLSSQKQQSLNQQTQVLKQNLDQARQQPFARVFLSATNYQPTIIAIATLQTQPWYVIFAQPEAILLAPIQKQIRSILVLACLIAIIVSISAVYLAQVLAQPLRYLTQMVSQFDPDRLNLRINLKSQDEVGMLVKAFNQMIERIECYAKDLAEANQQLEISNQILEQKVAERTAELEEANQELFRMVSLDPLTQVANRRHFNDCLSHAWEHHLQEQQPLALIFMDIDCFKRYNDFYGHQGGDECLAKVAQVMAQSLQQERNLVARYGGEEFVAILFNKNTHEALEMAESLQKAIATLAISHQGSEVSAYVTLSLGVASVVPTPEITPQSLIEKADQALYQAKNQGRNRAVVASPLTLISD